MEDLANRAVNPTVLRGLMRKGRRSAVQARGLSASTISLWLTAVSSFYRFVTTRYTVRTEDGRERPLHTYNPALTVKRPKVESYAKADFLNAVDLRALLGAINRNRLSGMRDYALFLGYVLTGRRNSEWRTIQWHDLTARGTRIFYTWRGKKTERAKNELPPPVWEAIRDYVDAAGRLGAMQPGDFVFTALSDNATRLPDVSRLTWDGNQPLSASAVNQLLKRYARKAGLDERRMHVHVLRHSAAMLEEELGASLTSISRFLGHADPKTTMRYVEHLRGRPDSTWRDKVRLLGLD